MAESLIQTIRSFVISENLIQRGDHILIGVSGGADSICLLTILHELRHDLGFQLTVAHIHHGLRKSAEDDMVFVQNLCKRLNIPCRCRRVKINASSHSLEDAARKKRLSALKALSRSVKADVVALAHHKDDLAETVLLRMIRGTGLLGLDAIAPKTHIEGLTVIRPLLNITRAQIETFLKTRAIRFRQDPTNRSKRFLRNRIRLELLPLLKTHYHSGIVSSLSHLALTAGQDYDFVEKQALADITRYAKNQKGKMTFPRKTFINRHPAMQRMLLRLMYCQCQASHFAPSLAQIDDARKKITATIPENCLLEKTKITVSNTTFSIQRV